MRILYIVLSVLFTLFGVVQINDPDPLFWVSYYLMIAILMGGASFGKYNRYATLAAIIITIIFLARLYPEFREWLNDGAPSIVESMKAETPYVEFVREFLGLLIGLLGLVFLLFQGKKIGRLER